MPKIVERRVVPYTPHQMFQLVAAIESYPDFLPWCRAVEVLERAKDGTCTARMTVGARGLSEHFTSIVNFDAPRAIHVRYGGGALTHLRNDWTFTPVGKGCEIGFEVDFGFRVSLLNRLIQAVLDQAFRKMVKAFLDRAAVLYGPQ